MFWSNCIRSATCWSSTRSDLADVLTTAVEVHGCTGRGDRVGPVLQDAGGQPGALPDPAAVGRRRIQEARHRPRGVLAQRGSAGVPVPRSQRSKREANGAPPPAPRCWKAHRTIPVPRCGPVRRARTPHRRTASRPTGNPLPCAGLTKGPYGPVPGGYRPPDVRSRHRTLPRCDGPGVPSAAFPGELSPTWPGRAGAAARTRPPGPVRFRSARCPGPADRRHPARAATTALIGPIPPAGPGPQVPPVGDMAPVDQGGGA